MALKFVSARQRDWWVKTGFPPPVENLSWTSSESSYVANIIEEHSGVHMDFDYTFYLNQKSCFAFELGRFRATAIGFGSKENHKVIKGGSSVKIDPKSFKIQDIIIQNHRFLYDLERLWETSERPFVHA